MYQSRMIYLTDGGLETTMIFEKGIELNHFAAFELLLDPSGREALREYYNHYTVLARRYDTGFIFESPTWRANPDWGFRLGYTGPELRAIQKNAIAFMREVANSSGVRHSVISGCLGPRADGYEVRCRMNTKEAKSYHMDQVKSFALADADIVTALTINYIEEGAGIALAAKDLHIPVVLSFTLGMDGRLPGGESLGEAIRAIDLETGSYPAFYMLNCVHPSHISASVKKPANWLHKIGGIRANASCKSHEELNESETLDAGDRHQLGKDHLEMVRLFPQLQVFGGCCGTDHGHIEEICRNIAEVNFGGEGKSPKLFMNMKIF